jgi:hypothetical protein
MKEIDKNDVNIAKLWNWGTQFKTETPQGMLTFWMRVVGDADLNRARVYGLRQSATLRRQLKTEGSDERLALVPELGITEKDKIVTAILVYSVTELTDRAQAKLDLKYPTDPKADATLEEHEEFQKEIDNWPAYVEKELRKLYNKEVGLEKKRLNKLSEDKLLEHYEETLINKLCENEMMKGFQDTCVFYASYLDETYKKPLFEDIEQFQNLPTDVKERFYAFYTSLNIPTEELKK